jgi:simple sugar transport system ATP-binding protein
VGELSGGNQQKVILARWLATAPAILILDEPTRGIDIGAHAEIIALIRRLCAQGMTVIVASSEIDELIAFCDKVVVMREGRKVAQLHARQISEQAIMAAIAHSA